MSECKWEWVWVSECEWWRWYFWATLLIHAQDLRQKCAHVKNFAGSASMDIKTITNTNIYIIWCIIFLYFFISKDIMYDVNYMCVCLTKFTWAHARYVWCACA